MSSKTDIANLTLAHCGVGKQIANLDTENSAEARAIRPFYEMARDAVLRDFEWPFATKFADLGLVETDPTDEWGYSYRYPSDCLKIRRILSGSRNDTLDTRASYKISSDDTGSLILTDVVDAQVEYTVRTTAVERYSPDFILALSYRLAVYAAAKLTAGDPFKLGDKAAKMYLFELGLARTSAVGEEQPDRPQESEFITGRD